MNKGGFISNRTGYRYIRRTNHPRALIGLPGYVREHIIVWEETYGEPLPEGWVIHHLNGIKHDNRPENLLALPRRDHSSKRFIIETLQGRIQELEDELKKCRKEAS